MNIEEISGEEIIEKFEMNLLLGTIQLKINFNNDDMYDLSFNGISNVLYIRNNIITTKRKREKSDKIYGELWDLSTENLRDVFIQNQLCFSSNIMFNIYNELFLLECSHMLWNQEILYSYNPIVKKDSTLIQNYFKSIEKLCLKFLSINSIEYYDDAIRICVKNSDNQENILSFSNLNAYLFLTHPKINTGSCLQIFTIHDNISINTNSLLNKNNDYYNNYTNNVKFNYYIMIDGKILMYLDAKFNE